MRAGRLTGDSVQITVQVNGREGVSGRDPMKNCCHFVEDPALRRFADGSEIKRVVYVPNRLLT
jgi:hypothetical protein